ncbi:MAG: NTP transferase domain-containing protein [Desulfovibrio sp.]|nr:NTP transferase domain-containing protein [Desulfovibrio sp.]
MYAFCGQRFVVTGHHAGLLEPAAPGWGLRAVRNPRPEDGMFSSIRAGLHAVLKQARAEGVEPEQGGVFIHPVDVPLTRRLTLLALLRAADVLPGTALQAAFCGEPGHPVFLPLSLVPAILAHDGHDGLRGALASVPCRQVPVADAAMLPDMDTPEQYAILQTMAAGHDALTRDEAEGLLLQAGVPERGLRHALAVGRVAEALCAALAEARGEEDPVETALALASGLTHDICKGVHGHEAAGGRLLARLGLSRMAAIVAAHRDQSVPAEKKLGAHELVYLADKYCRGGIWVPVAQRFAQKLEEFGADPGARAGIEGRRDRALALERRLAVELGRDPAQLARKVLDAADIGTRAQMLDARRALWTPPCPLAEEV